MSAKIRACPHCGNSGIDCCIERWVRKEGKSHKTYYRVYCRKCLFTTDHWEEGTSIEKALEYWNTRPMEDAAIAIIKELRDTLLKAGIFDTICGRPVSVIDMYLSGKIPDAGIYEEINLQRERLNLYRSILEKYANEKNWKLYSVDTDQPDEWIANCPGPELAKNVLQESKK